MQRLLVCALPSIKLTCHSRPVACKPFEILADRYQGFLQCRFGRCALLVRYQIETFFNCPSPLRSSVPGFRESFGKFIQTARDLQRLDQEACLIDILLAFRNTVCVGLATRGDDQFVDGIALGRRHCYGHTGPVQHHRAYGLMDQEIQKTQRLCGCPAERRHRARMIGIVVGSPVRRQELDLVSRGVLKLRDAYRICAMGNCPKSRVNAFENFEYGGKAVFNG